MGSKHWKITDSRHGSEWEHGVQQHIMNNILNTCSLACSHIPVIILWITILFFFTFSIVIVRKKKKLNMWYSTSKTYHFTFFSCFSKHHRSYSRLRFRKWVSIHTFFYKYYLQLYKKSWSIIKCCSCTLLCYFINDMIFVYVSISRASSMRERDRIKAESDEKRASN